MQHDICRRLKGSHWSRNFLLGWAWRKIVQSLLTRLAFWKMVKMVSPLTCREGARCWFQWWRTDINMSKFVVVSKQYFTKFRSGQRPPEAKGIAHDDVIYPIYCNCQNCAILGKASKHVRFMSCLSQKTDLSLEGGDGWATACFSDKNTQPNTEGHPACAGSCQITTHCWPPLEYVHQAPIGRSVGELLAINF